jgi:hypothetical protein
MPRLDKNLTYDIAKELIPLPNISPDVSNSYKRSYPILSERKQTSSSDADHDHPFIFLTPAIFFIQDMPD